MLFITSVVLVSMVDFNNSERIMFLKWISVISVTGVSLITLVLLSRNTHTAYKTWGGLVSVLLATIIPSAVSVFIYLISIFINYEAIGKIYILENLYWIMGVNILILLIVDTKIISKETATSAQPPRRLFVFFRRIINFFGLDQQFI